LFSENKEKSNYFGVYECNQKNLKEFLQIIIKLILLEENH